MGFRTLEITGPAELHVRLGSLVIEKEQSLVLDILCLPGADQVRAFAEKTSDELETDSLEAAAAKLYFQYLCPGINRRDESPINSCLNYGYSIIRNSLIRAIISAGLLPSFGIHHQNLFNAFNLADDLIEPFRPCIDLVAYKMEADSCTLSRQQRMTLTKTLQNAVLYGTKQNVGSFSH